MRTGPVALSLLAMLLIAGPLAIAQPSQHATLGETNEPITPPITMPVEGGPYPAGPQYLPDGTIGINGPITITQPGRYVVLQDLTSYDTIIRVKSSNVELDIGGHRLFTQPVEDYSLPVITIGPAAELPLRKVTIRNGTLLGGWGWSVLDAYSGGTALVLEDITMNGATRISGWRDLRISRVSADGYRAGISIGATDCTITNSSFYTIIDGGMSTNLDLNGCVLTQSRMGGSRVSISGERSIIRNNIFESNESIRLRGYGHEFAYNYVSGVHAFTVEEATGIQIVGNIIKSFEVSPALRFTATAKDNVYRENTAVGQCEGVDDQGTDNISHGDNYMPDPM